MPSFLIPKHQTQPATYCQRTLLRMFPHSNIVMESSGPARSMSRHFVSARNAVCNAMKPRATQGSRKASCLSPKLNGYIMSSLPGEASSLSQTRCMSDQTPRLGWGSTALPVSRTILPQSAPAHSTGSRMSAWGTWCSGSAGCRTNNFISEISLSTSSMNSMMKSTSLCLSISSVWKLVIRKEMS